ncbi:heparan-alpha-glucosaminide N-acetyltransferase-like, partial [Trifolium medium]|nr:heparan-alpha-glucosaminide N-acetyltransferase-like [Trifolium medium]
ECSINSPDYGPLPPDAPTWCQAPFDPEGLLR